MKQILTPSIYIRFKPHSKSAIQFTNNTTMSINTFQKRSYSFDYVFQPHHSTRELFQICCKNHVSNCIKNITKSSLIFVYGNTGTGKTYTIGLLDRLDETSEGLIPLSLKHIFSLGCQVSLTFYEIYNEEIFDLLNSGCKPLQIRENQKQPYLQGLLEISVSNYLEAVQLINIGREQRKVAEQKLNRNSSRSHAILTIYIHHQNSTSKLCFVDLAGSERLKQSQSKGINKTEAVHINSSLSSLQTVLVGLATNCQASFRASKLTRLLQPYFSSSISMIVTSNGANIQNIEFAKRCKNIKIIQQSEDEQALSRIKYLQQELIKAKRYLKRESLLTPRNSSNKQNLGRSAHSQSKQIILQDKIQIKNLEKTITKLVTILQSTYKALETFCISSNPTQQAYKFVRLLQIQDLDIRKFIQQRLSVLKQTIEIPKLKITAKQILESMHEIDKFNKKVTDLGIVTIELGNKLFSNRKYIQQLCTRELKCYLLQKKGKHNEDIIAFLLSKVDKKQFVDVQAQLKRMRVKIQVDSERESYIRIQEQK